MLVNFREISQIAILVYEFEEILVINGLIVDMFSYPTFISSYYDA